MTRFTILPALACIALWCGGCRHGSRSQSMNDVTPPEAKKILDSDQRFIYLDVRTVPEFVEGHAPGAWNVPVVLPAAGGTAMERNPKFLPTIAANFSKDQHMIIGCRSGGRSALAADLLRDAGYKSVRNMEGGFGGSEDVPGWAECGYPVEKGSGGERSYEALAGMSR